MINLNVNRVEAIRDDIERGDGLVEFDIEVLAIGGGGAGGTVSFLGGGGAGGFISASWIIPPKTTFDVQIGSGSQDTLITLASDSSVVFRADAGGDAQDGDGENGGSGGAGGGGVTDTGGLSVSPTIPSTRAILAYATGSDGGRGFSGNNNAGGGGGVNSAGANASGLSPGAGGAFINITDTFVNGLVSGVTILAGGGDGTTSGAGPALPYPANSGHGGDGGSSNTQGASGLFAIKYSGLPKASGGTITQSGGFTTHVFTGSAQLITTGRSNNNP